jgi:hypothetical protein
MAKHLLVAVLALTIDLASSLPAAAQTSNDERGGTPGHVTAWDTDRRTLIAVDACPVTQAGAWDYDACGARLRAGVARRLCAARGRGEHGWYYQVGSGPLVAQPPTSCR